VSPYFRIGLVFAAMLLAGCGQVTARTLGLTRDAPDEFQVTTRAPLSMPSSRSASCRRPTGTCCGLGQ
jgi:hypothetical protein